MKTTLSFMALNENDGYPSQEVTVEAGDPIPNIGDHYEALNGKPLRITGRRFIYDESGTGLTIFFYLGAT